MKYRVLGDSDLRVSEICLGTWTTFGGSLADDGAVALVDDLGALTEVVDAGKARFVGVSNWSGDQIRGAVELARERGFAKIVSLQPEYSLVHREPEEDVIPASRENGVSQIVYSPLAQGVLSGKYRPGESFAEDTRAAARRDGSVWEYMADDALERIQRLRPLADGLGLSMAQLALAWILREPNVASAIVGASRPEQLRDNAVASGVDLDEETVRAIEAVFA